MNPVRCRLFTRSNRRLVAAIASCALSLVASADNWAPNITTTATWQDNATNANLPSNRIGALQTAADLTLGQRYGVGRNDAFHLTAHFAAEWWPRFNGLSEGLAGARAEWRHKFGLGAFAPVFSAEAAADAIAAKETGRRGTLTGITLGLRKRLDDTWRAALTQEFIQRSSEAAVFDRTASVTALEIERELTDLTRLTLRASYRDGDVLSYGTPPRPDLVGLASHRMPVDAFGTSRVAYSIDARTLGLRAGLARTLGQNSALVFNYEVLWTDRSSLSYVNHLVSLALVHQY